MYGAELCFQSSTDQLPHDVLEIAGALVHALRMNGQVCGSEFPDAFYQDRYIVHAFIPEESALAPERHNKHVRRDLERLAEAGVTRPRLTVLGEETGAGVCRCQSPSTYLLFREPLSLESPLRCGNCFSPVPLYRVPPTYDGEYYDVICWQSDHASCSRLGLNCRVALRAVTSELSRVGSNLSQDGLSICNKIHASTSIPVYYHLDRYYGRSYKRELERQCPLCGGAWLLERPWHGWFDFRCDQCRLVSTIALSLRSPARRGRSPAAQRETERE